MVKHQRVSKYYYLDCRCFFDVLYHVKFIFCCLANLLTIFWGFSILFPPKKRCALLSLLVLNMMRWILQEFSFTEFALKLFKKHSKLKLRLWTISSNIFPYELIVLSSAELHISNSETRKMHAVYENAKQQRI